jgi:hypothetical protein
VHPGIGTISELFGYVATFKPGDDVETAFPDNASDLFDSDIGISPQVRHIAIIMFIGKNKANVQPDLVEGMPGDSLAAGKFHRGDRQTPVDSLAFSEYPQDFLKIKA